MNIKLFVPVILACAVVACPCFAKDTVKKPVVQGKWTKHSVYKCHKADSEIVIDGVLDEPAWKKAAVISDLWQANSYDFGAGKPVPGHYETQKTRARVLYDDNYIYVSAEMDDTDLLGLTVKDDTEFVEGIDDLFEFFFKPDPHKPGYYEFHVFPTNAKRDVFFAKRFARSYLGYMDYESGIETAVKLYGTLNDWHDIDKGWTVEARVPMSAFKETGGGPKEGDTWQFLISRYNYAYHLKYGNEIVQMVALNQVTFHLYESYPKIQFVK